MPSNANPVTTVLPGSGPQLSGGSGGAGNVGAALLAHISDPTDAHAASAIGYLGGGTWADGVTNPAATVEAQLDKVIIDLATGDGAGKIQYNGGAAWADGTTNPAATLGVQLDKFITDLSAITGSTGSHKIGVDDLTNTNVAIPAGSLWDTLTYLVLAENHQYFENSTWADGTIVPEATVQNVIDNIVQSLASIAAPNGGTRRLGGEQIVNTSATITAGTLLSQLTLLSRAANLQYNPGPAWLGGRTNGATTVQLQLDKIVNDLGATTAADDGAERIGAQVVGALAAGSVRSQLNELDVNWGKTDRNNTWSNTQNIEGPAGDVFASLAMDITPADRKLILRSRMVTTAANVYFRIYSDRDRPGYVVTYNCFWDTVSSLWGADDTTDAASLWRMDDLSARFYRKTTTSTAWTIDDWDGNSSLSYQQMTLGNTTVSGPASIVCSIQMENPRVQFLNTAAATGSDSNPPETQGVINELRAKNIPKAWGCIRSGATPLALAGFNIADVDTTGNTCTVTWASGMDDDDYAVAIIGMSSEPHVCYVTARTNTTVTFEAYDAQANAQIDLSASTRIYSVILFGRQDS